MFCLVASLSGLVAEIVSTIVSNAFSCAQTRKYATAARYWFIYGSPAANSYNQTKWVAFAAVSCGTGLWVFATVYGRSLQ